MEETLQPLLNLLAGTWPLWVFIAAGSAIIAGYNLHPLQRRPRRYDSARKDDK